MLRVVPTFGLVLYLHQSTRARIPSVSAVVCFLLSPTFQSRVVFQQIDVEDSETGSVPGIRMFGVTQVRQSSHCVLSSSLTSQQEGYSVMAHVTDFYPYFYVAVPRGLEEKDSNQLIFHLNVSRFGPQALVSSFV